MTSKEDCDFTVPQIGFVSVLSHVCSISISGSLSLWVLFQRLMQQQLKWDTCRWLIYAGQLFYINLHIPVSSQLQLWTLFLLPKGVHVHVRELQLYKFFLLVNNFIDSCKINATSVLSCLVSSVAIPVLIPSWLIRWWLSEDCVIVFCIPSWPFWQTG